MSEAIFALITKEQTKCQRRRENVEATKAEIEILGDSPKLRNRLARQEAAVQESLDNLEKLNKAAGTKVK